VPWWFATYIYLLFLLALSIRQVPPVKVARIMSRREPVYRARIGSRPSISIEALPEVLMVLSDIRIRMSFLFLMGQIRVILKSNFLLENTSFAWFFEEGVILSLSTVMLLFRKPPDEWIAFNDFVIQVRKKRNWLVRFILIVFLLFYRFSTFAPKETNSSTGCTNEFNQEPYVENYPMHDACTAAMLAEQQNEARPRDMGVWDSDAFPIVLDSGASRTLTPDFSDLIDPRPYVASLTGVGQGTITHVGRVQYQVLDDSGVFRLIVDDEAYYSPSVPYRLLCPHAWRDQMLERCDADGDLEGAGAYFGLDPHQPDAYVLSWNNGRISVTVPLDPQINLPILYPNNSYCRFNAFAAGFSTFPKSVPDDDSTPMPATFSMPGMFSTCIAEAAPKPDTSDDASTESTVQEGEARYERFDTETRDKSTTGTSNDEDVELLMSWHIKLGHASFEKLRWAAEQGILPKRLSKCRNMVCPACLYGKQKRRPWRHKGKSNRPIKQAIRPGQYVSCDQLQSSIPGLIAQTTGKLTKSRYMVATIFVDHYSGLDYVHLQESTSADETIEAKQAFERFASEHGVKIEHYHCDNGIFASRAFREAVKNSGQSISFCGVGAHHQNGIAEKRIQDLSDMARALLTHAAHRNPAVTSHLWPYALRHASYVRRMLPATGSDKSPEEIFSAAPVRPTTRFLHPFGCPVYVLSDDLQGGKSIPRWDERSRVGVYVGHSAQHSPTVSLILNPQTGYISPQFHCVFDDNFDTPSQDAKFSAIWEEKAGFKGNTDVYVEIHKHLNYPISKRPLVFRPDVPKLRLLFHHHGHWSYVGGGFSHLIVSSRFVKTPKINLLCHGFQG